MKTSFATRWRIVGHLMIALGLLGAGLMLAFSIDSLPTLLGLIGLGISGSHLG